VRDYSKVSGSFWTGKTGKLLRGNVEAQLTALYLMTSPHANMIGVFYCPIGYIHLDSGLSIEGATKGLQSLVEGGFCTYDHDSDTVFVHEMAKFQIGDALKPTDNRVKDIQKQYDNLPDGLLKQGFFDKYSQAFCLIQSVEKESPSQAPSKPETGAGAGTEKPKTTVRSVTARFNEFWLSWPSSPRKVAKNACEKKWSAKKLDLIADQILQHVASMKLTKQWLDGFDPAPLTYINQGRWSDEVFVGDGKSLSNTKPWYISSTGIEAKGRELKIELLPDENFVYYKARVYEAAGITNDMIRAANQDYAKRA